MLGQTISHYRILEKLGGGGMGVVYRAEDLKLGRVVALKFLPGDISHDDEAIERFTREARAASALDHPNLCTVHEIGEGDDGRLFIAMACYDGETLKRKIERGPIPIDDALRYATQVAEGLAAAHARGIVHRDIKPANVIVTSDGRVKILDFGLAKLINESRLTRSGHTSGTPAYMSPEQIQGDVVDARTDLWSLGSVLFEMIAGQRAFRGESDQAVIHSILHEPRETLATYRTGVTPELERVIERSLQKDRGRRYENAREMIDDLRACLHEENTVTVMRQALRRVTPRRALSAAVLVLALAAPIWFMASRHVTPLPPSRTSLVIFPFTIRGNSNVGFLREGLVELLSRKIDGVNEIHVVDPGIVFNRVRGRQAIEPAEAQVLAAKMSASHFVTGTVVESGGKIRASAALADAGGEVQATAEATVESEKQLFALVDQLAMRLLAFQKIGTDRRLNEVAVLSTQSFDALKAYLQGETENRRGLLRTAVESYQEAVKRDPAFALAWFRLSEVQAFDNKSKEAVASSDKALALIDHLPERDRRIVRGWDAFLRGKGRDAEIVLQEAVRIHPNDVEAWTLLAETKFHLGQYQARGLDRARDANLRLLELDPQNQTAIAHLAHIAILNPDRAHLDDLLRRYHDAFRNSDLTADVRDIEVIHRFLYDDRTRLLADLQEQDRLGEHWAELTWMSLLYADFDFFDRYHDLLVPKDQPLDARAQRLVRNAFVQAGRGKWKEAREKLRQAKVLDHGRFLNGAPVLYTAPFLPLERAELDQLRSELVAWKPQASRSQLSLPTPRNRLYLLGRIEAALGNRSAVFSRATELRGLPPAEAESGSFADDCGRLLLALYAGRNREGLRHLNEIRFERLYPGEGTNQALGPSYVAFLRGDLLQELGLYDEAAQWYESIVRNRLRVTDFLYLAVSRLRLAECHERMGRHAEAAREYAAFVEVWKDCDPEFKPMVDRARERVAALARQNGEKG